jgi:hypothetical protein
VPTTWLWTAMLLVGLAVAAATLAVTSLILVARMLLGVRRSEPDPPAAGVCPATATTRIIKPNLTRRASGNGERVADGGHI